jgi:hypothetical protein
MKFELQLRGEQLREGAAGSLPILSRRCHADRRARTELGQPAEEEQTVARRREAHGVSGRGRGPASGHERPGHRGDVEAL